MFKRTGWIPDLPDHRDFVWGLGVVPAGKEIDLTMTPYCPPVYDQGDMSSCTGNSTETMQRFVHRKLGLGDFEGSRLFLYNEARMLEGSLRQDNGAAIRDVLKVLAKKGVCLERDFAYLPKNLLKAPPPAVEKKAVAHEATKYSRMTTFASMLACLEDGYPFVTGITVYDSFMSDAVAATGEVPMPGPSEGVQGGHAVCVMGVLASRRRFLVRNSWGPAWGIAGNFTIPFEYLADKNLCDDSWTIRIEK